MEALKILLEEGPTTIRNQLPDWMVEHVEGRQVLYYQGKNYIPKDEELRRDIAKMFHDHPTAGHPGELEMYNSIRQHYWWPGLRTYIKNYVQGCKTCQQFKINRQPTKPSFLPVTTWWLSEESQVSRPFVVSSLLLLLKSLFRTLESENEEIVDYWVQSSTEEFDYSIYSFILLMWVIRRVKESHNKNQVITWVIGNMSRRECESSGMWVTIWLI